MSNEFLRTFGRIYNASGALGIDGKGYWYDKFLNLIPGHDFDDSTFIAKTVSLDPRYGNLPLKKNLKPKNKWPDCIKIWPFSGHMMNAVGVSSPGLETLLNEEIWDDRLDAFLISIIPVRETYIERMKEIREISDLISKHKFITSVGIQLNISCPNINIDVDGYSEIYTYLSFLKDTKLPIDLKINVLTPVEKIIRLVNELDININMVTCSNTIPFGSFPNEIDWTKYSGLEKYGGGGLSGPILLPYVIDWIKRFRNLEKIFPLKACGGIFSKEDVDKVVEAGADAIEIGTVKLMRPWRIKSIVKRAKELLGENNI